MLNYHIDRCPNGQNRTNLEIFGSTPFFSSRQFMVTGRVAELEAVPQAVVRAPDMFFMNLNGRLLVNIE